MPMGRNRSLANINANKSTYTAYRGREVNPKDRRYRTYNRPVMVFDETGSMGYLKSGVQDDRPEFVIVSAIILDRESFANVSSLFPKKNRAGFKYSNATAKDVKPIVEKLSRIDFTFSEIHRSRRNEAFMSNKDRIEFYVQSISELMDFNDPHTPFDVLIDAPPVNAVPELELLCAEKFENGMELEWFEVKSSYGEKILQVHDFVTGLTGDYINGIESDKSKTFDKIIEKRRFRAHRFGCDCEK